MIYYLWRCVILIILFIILFLYIYSHKHKIKQKKKIWIIVTVMYVFIMWLILAIPFEYLWLKFDTMDKAFQYNHIGDKILEKYEFDNYGFIVFEYKDGSKGITALLKNNSSWRMENRWLIKTTNINYNYKLIHAIRIKKYQVAYINISYFDLDGEYTSISDSKNNSFSCKENKKSNLTGYECQMIVEDIEDNYHLRINDYDIYLK